MENGTKVKLVSFNGMKEAPDECDPKENYWRLLNFKGVVVNPSKDSEEHRIMIQKGRFLVRFDKSIKNQGLHCHNEVSNTLWILQSDLEPIL